MVSGFVRAESAGKEQLRFSSRPPLPVSFRWPSGLSMCQAVSARVQLHRATVDRVEVPHPREYLVAFGITEAAWIPIPLVPQRITPPG